MSDTELFSNGTELAPIFTLAPAVEDYSELLDSKVLNCDFDVNPLVACAAAIFALLRTIKNSPHANTRNDFLNELKYELKVFTTKARNQNYGKEIISMSRYVLASVLDEAIQETSWGKENQWREHGLLQVYYQESWGGSRFFQLLERALQNSKYYIQVLELYYICLSLGYEGKYRYEDDGVRQLNAIQDNIYKIIKSEKGASEKHLAPDIPEPQEIIAKKKSKLPLMFTILFALAVIVVVYFSFSYIIDLSMQPLYHNLQPSVTLHEQ